MNRQEIFDKVWLGLKSQGFEKSLNDEGDCAYRGKNGMKCAAGHLIPDEEYREEFESRLVCSSEFNTCPTIVEITNQDDAYFVMDLQAIHDSKEPTLMEDRLRDYAKSKCLSVPE